MAKTLRDLRVDFASLVDEPANKHARVMLFKRDDSASSPKSARGAGYCPPDDEDDEDKPKGKKRMAEKAEKATVTDAAPEVEKKADAPVSEDIQKRMADLEKRAADAEKRAQEADEIAKSERDKRETREWVEVAKGYSALSIEADKFGPVLKRVLAGATAEDRAEVERVLKSANEIAEKSALFSETGRPGGESQSAMERVNTLAAQMVTDGKAKDYPAAVAAIAKSKEHAALMAEYQASRN